ncbi:nuclear transport factor 2 family protein [Streptomyces sp. R39]|uniref:Nuclear transport factor 2 family protein n=1 Tax=Streptomyces sp. R39 TaxID=3238631 RepID=A0AB39R695_9ACTN
MTTREVVERFFGLLGAGDPDAVVPVFADDIDWYVPGLPSLLWTGHRSKSEEVADHLRTLGNNIVPERNVDQVDTLLVDGEHAIMLGRFTRVAKSTGRTYDMPVAMHFRAESDRIVQLHLHEDTLKVFQA